MANQLKNGCIFTVLILFLWACRKSNYETVAPDSFEKNWIHLNGGFYRNETLALKRGNGEIIKSRMNWSAVRRFNIGRGNYTEIPFITSASSTTSDVTRNGSEAGQVTWSFVMRTVEGKVEAAVKYTIEDAIVDTETGEKIGKVECFSQLDGRWINTWFTEKGTGRLMRQTGTSAQVVRSSIGHSPAKNERHDYMAEICVETVTNTYRWECWETGNSYDDVACGWIFMHSTRSVYCYYEPGGGDGGGGWPPSPPPGGPGGGGGGNGNSNTPCPTSGAVLKTVFPTASQANLDTVAAYLNEYGPSYGIDDIHKIRHFLSQAAAETGLFGTLTKSENLDYSTAALLVKNYPKKFSFTDPTKLNPNNYLHNAEKLANAVYAKTNWNGDVASGDGYRYRGRGIFQLTFKENYTKFKNYFNSTSSEQIDPVSNPDLLTSANKYSIISAMWFYKKFVLEKMTVDGDTEVSKITSRVNGGSNGLDVRRKAYNNLKTKLNCL